MLGMPYEFFFNKNTAAKPFRQKHNLHLINREAMSFFFQRNKKATNWLCWLLSFLCFVWWVAQIEECGNCDAVKTVYLTQSN